MSTDAQRAANHANAKKSTGPRSREGKARASQNATRHGLARSVAKDPAAQDRMAALAAALAGEGASPALQVQAAVVAEAQVDLHRARAARIHLQSRWIDALETLCSAPAGAPGEEIAAHLARIDRYERRALSRRRTAVQRLDELRVAEGRSDT
jgi:hypothetical protein